MLWREDAKQFIRKRLSDRFHFSEVQNYLLKLLQASQQPARLWSRYKIGGQQFDTHARSIKTIVILRGGILRKDCSKVFSTILADLKMDICSLQEFSFGDRNIFFAIVKIQVNSVRVDRKKIACSGSEINPFAGVTFLHRSRLALKQFAQRFCFIF